MEQLDDTHRASPPDNLGDLSSEKLIAPETVSDIFGIVPSQIRKRFWQDYVVPGRSSYAVTISPPFRGTLFKLQEINYYREMLPKHFIVCEFDEERIHFHGVCSFGNKPFDYLFMKRLQAQMTRVVGFTMIKPLGKNYLGWYKYMFKDINKTSEKISQPWFTYYSISVPLYQTPPPETEEAKKAKELLDFIDTI